VTVNRILTATDLARDLGYGNPTPAFWRACRKRGLRTLPGKPFAFDYSEAMRAFRSL